MRKFSVNVNGTKYEVEVEEIDAATAAKANLWNSLFKTIPSQPSPSASSCHETAQSVSYPHAEVNTAFTIL